MLFNEACRTFTHVSNIGHKLSKVTNASQMRSHLPLLDEAERFPQFKVQTGHMDLQC